MQVRMTGMVMVCMQVKTDVVWYLIHNFARRAYNEVNRVHSYLR